MKRKIFKGLVAVLAVTVLVCLLSVTSYAQSTYDYRIERSAGDGLCLVKDGQRVGEGSLQALFSMLPTDAQTPVRVYLDGICSSETLVIAGGRLQCSGSLTLTGGARLEVCEGAEVTLSALSLTLSADGVSDGGYVRIKDGTLTVDGAELDSDAAAAVVLDHTAAARCLMYAGRIRCTGEQAVLAKTGTVELLGGEVISYGGCAVRCHSTLRLGAGTLLKGACCEIRTDRPVWLSCRGAFFSGSVRICYDARFFMGKRQAVLYGASPDMLAGVELCDADGERMPLSFSEEADGERGILSVDRPFTVRFLSEGVCVKEMPAYTGDTVSPPEAPPREGYTFDGWYTDVQGTSPFTGQVAENVTVYARYRLLPPTYRLKSLSFIYDAGEHLLRFESLSHPRLADGALQYAWYKDGVPMSEVRCALPIRTVMDSGTYRCHITLTVGADTVSLMTEEVRVTVSPRLITPPTPPSVPYTGRWQTADIPPSTFYTTLENGGGTHAGEYPVTLVLTDPDNTAWQGGEAAAWETVFVIERAVNVFTDTPSVHDVFEGQIPTVKAAAKYGNCKYLFAKTAEGEYTADVPRTAGTYFLSVTVDGCDDYTALASAPVPFTVYAVVPQAIRLLTVPDKSEYVAFEQFCKDGLSVTVIFNDGTERTLLSEDLTVLYSDGRDSLRAHDAFVTVCYGELRLPVAVSVDLAVYDLTGVCFPDGARVYNGRTQTLSLLGTLPVGEDGHALRVTYTGGGASVGEYDVYAAFSTESDQYRLPETLHARLTVTPCPVKATWTVPDFVYDGTAHIPTATACDLYGRPLSLTVTGAAVKASDACVAYCASVDANYTVENDTCPFTVRKAEYDMSGVYWSVGDFVYDGTAHTVSLTGLPQGVTLVGYTDATAMEAGTYTARCTLLYDSENYEAPVVSPCTYEVRPASYDMSGVAFPPATLVYTGEVQYPVQVGQLPVGLDGSRPHVIMDVGARDVTDGTVHVTVRFESGSKNYLAPPSVASSVTVVPMAVEVTWDVPDFVYDGRMHAPTAVCETVSVTVTGAQSAAGTFVARAYANDENYTVRNDRCVFSIAKAANAWLVPPQVDDAFLGRSPHVSACALVGEATVAFFRDAACLVPIDALTEAGQYYAVVSVTGEENYEDLFGAPVPFRMIAVVPTELRVTLRDGAYLAFERVEDRPFCAEVVYNDGHVEPLSFSALTVTYGAADSFRYGDTQVSVCAMGLALTLSVTVEKAPLPLTGVSWTGEGLTYTGEEQTVTLTGLPEGVSVREYRGNTVTLAGEYTASAVLDFDRENFTHEGVLYYAFSVRRAVVPLPEISADVYCGEWLSAAVPPSELYTVKEPVGAVRAGTYPVTLLLTDADNYCFEGGASRAEIAYTVRPRPTTVTVEDVYLYTDQRTPPITYRITAGEVCEGDSLGISVTVEDGVLTARADNPDYEVTFILGRVVDTGRLSPERQGLLWLCVLLFLTVCLLLLAAMLWRYRYRVRRAVLREGRTLPPSAVPALALPPTPPPAPCAPCDTDADGMLSEVSFEEATRRADALLQLQEGKMPTDGDPLRAACAPSDAGITGACGVEQAMCAVDAARADALISDDLAGHLVGREVETVHTYGRRRVILNVDTLNGAFLAGERVDVNILKEKYLIPYDTGYLKILAGGILDKALEVYADSFSLQAVKMIALTGGHAIRAVTVGEDTARRKKTGKRAKRH